ncbi:MAG: hypothetical protein ACJ77M_16680 [Thermoleophilaceae bacterium]
MPPAGLLHVSIGGSFLCEGYELRVTQRCLEEDLATTTDSPFDDLATHEIITAFVKRRRDNPSNTRTVAPLSSGKTVYRLAYGDRHRGATWHDEDHGVVWLLAYAQHEFKARGDAFPYFKELDAGERLLPTAEDYEALFRDRDGRFVAVVSAEAEELLQTARAQPGEEQRGLIGGQLGVGVSVEVVETLEEVYLAVKFAGLTPDNLPILLAAFFPNCTADEIEGATRLPSRNLDPDEMGFRALVA